MAENPNTNAIAYQQLRPLANTNLGGILEEHTRYWKKYKDEEEAEELARKALQAKANKEDGIAERKYVESNLGLGDSDAYFRLQNVADYERMLPELVKQSKLAYNGDRDAILKVEIMKQNLKNLTSLDKLSGKAIGDLIASDDKYNKWIDGDQRAFAKNIIDSNYRFYEQDIIMLDEDGNDTTRFTAQQMRDKLNSLGTYSGKAKFNEYSDDIATKLLDSKDGAKEIDAQTKVDGIKSINSVFASDTVELRSFYNYATKTKDVDGNPLFDPSQPLRDLDKTQLNQLAGLYYDEFVDAKVRQIKNGLDRASKAASLETKNRTNKEAKGKEVRIIPKKNEQGDILSKDGKTSFQIINGNIKTADDNKTKQEVIGGSLDANNQLTLDISETTKKPIVEVPNPNDLLTGKEYPVKTEDGVESLIFLGRKGRNLDFAKTNSNKEIIEGSETTVEVDDLQPFDTGRTEDVIRTRSTSDDDEISILAGKLGLDTTEGLFNKAIESGIEPYVERLGQNKRRGNSQSTDDKGILD